jgi:hypothetical protein
MRSVRAKGRAKERAWDKWYWWPRVRQVICSADDRMLGRRRESAWDALISIAQAEEMTQALEGSDEPCH